MKTAWVAWPMIKMVLTGLRLWERRKLLTLKRVLETKLNFNFKLRNQDRNLQNLKGQNKDYPIFKITVNCHQLVQVQLEELSQIFCLLQPQVPTWWEVLTVLTTKYLSLENCIAAIISVSIQNVLLCFSRYK